MVLIVGALVVNASPATSPDIDATLVTPIPPETL